ncbi:MAG: fibronectin type III domain-containing protein, partial [Bacteroidia bacterium]|nr:fibronectin type III domain-containing protein [Bacteroidia bacterium]
MAQSCANYITTRTTGITYNSISTTGASVPSWRNNTGLLEQDDNRSNPIDIGFDFWYLGTRYTQFCVSTNGFIDFNISNPSNGTGVGAYGYQNSAFTNNTALTALALAPIYDDFTTQGGNDPLGNGIKYQVSGTAPNRVLTVEWINIAVYGNTTPNLNFQIKLYESTGVIEFIYGNMTPGTAAFSYTCGINAATQSPNATAAELKNQLVANTNSFGNTETNNLSTIPTSNSKITFTPPTPTPATGTITFSAVTKTSMTLTWTAWATGHLGYVIYNSTDNTNFNFVAQTAPTVNTFNATGLLAGTTYYWRVYAVSEGRLSTFLTASQSTLPAGTFRSVINGDWGSPSTWDVASVPTAGDNVIISNGTIVTVNNNFACNHLTVGEGISGILRIGSGAVPRTLTVNGNLTINTGGQLLANTNQTNNLTVNGSSIINNGTIDLNTGTNICYFTSNRNGNLTLSGSATLNRFHNMYLNLGGNINNTFEITSNTFSAVNNFLNLTSGTFKYSVTGNTTINPRTAGFTLMANQRIWMNAALSTLNLTGGDIVLQGNITVTAGNLV